MAKAGRKGLYDKWLQPENLKRVETWRRNGATYKDVAKKIGVSEFTVNEWINRFPQFSDAIKKGAEEVDDEVENALLKLALGYSYEETRVEIMPDGTKKGVQYTKMVPPNLGAQAFWLKNRRRNKWQDFPRPDKADDSKVQIVDDL